MTEFKGKSMKGATDGELWQPTSSKQAGGDGKEYSVPSPNPTKGNEPSKIGFYTGHKLIEVSYGTEKKLNKMHQFEDSDGNVWKMWGSTTLDSQLEAAQKEFGLGRFTKVIWGGLLLKPKSKDKPASALKSTDYYHDWEVIVDEETPAIKVAGAEVYKATPSNAAATTSTAAPVAIPESLPTSLPPTKPETVKPAETTVAAPVVVETISTPEVVEPLIHVETTENSDKDFSDSPDDLP